MRAGPLIDCWRRMEVMFRVRGVGGGIGLQRDEPRECRECEERESEKECACHGYLPYAG